MTDPINNKAVREAMRRAGEALTQAAAPALARIAEERANAAAKAPDPILEEPETSLWRFAIRVPEGREADVTRLLDEAGYEVYRAWPVSEDQERSEP